MRLVLVASGDNPAATILAPYFPEGEHYLLTSIARCLDDYRFGAARYRRTKLLSWLFALLFQPSETAGELTIRSTAKQIDSLFTSIRSRSEASGKHKLADQGILVDLIRKTNQCLEAHSSADCWDGRFKDDDKGQKWQELQLVASLVGVFLIGSLEDSPDAILDSHRSALLDFTSKHQRPEKTQNKTQWAFIGQVALGIVAEAGIDEGRLGAALVSKYGVNCLPTLRAARGLHRPRAND